jgi:CrcB protein
LLRGGATIRALLNVVLSIVLCILAVSLGHLVAAHFNGGAAQIAQLDIEEEA